MREPRTVQCRHCRGKVTLMLDPADVLRWRQGECIQHAMPYLTPGEREVLISGFCEPCFDTLFEEDE